MSDNHQWQQYDHHDVQQCTLTDEEQQAVIETWERQNKDEPSFDDMVNEIRGGYE